MQSNKELLAILILILMVIALGLAGNEDKKTTMPRITKEEAAVRHQQDRDDAAAMSLFGMGEKR